MTVRYAVKIIKKICLLSFCIAFIGLIVDKNRLSSVIIAWVSMVITLIEMLFDWKEWKEKMEIAYKIGDVELISTSVDVENHTNTLN